MTLIVLASAWLFGTPAKPMEPLIIALIVDVLFAIWWYA
jgi:hypothetical protein